MCHALRRYYTGFDIELWEEIAQRIGIGRLRINETSLKGIFKDLVEGKPMSPFHALP
jgi:ABC-type amino acid transport substrate-binding protein